MIASVALYKSLKILVNFMACSSVAPLHDVACSTLMAFRGICMTLRLYLCIPENAHPVLVVHASSYVHTHTTARMNSWSLAPADLMFYRFGVVGLCLSLFKQLELRAFEVSIPPPSLSSASLALGLVLNCMPAPHSYTVVFFAPCSLACCKL